MKKAFKTLLFFAILFLINTISVAQEGIDTALFKQYKVKKMWVWVKLPILPNRTLDDSCKAEIYEMDTLARVIYQNNLISCYGWEGSTESFNTYDSKDRIIFSKQFSKDFENHIRYYYNSKNDLVKIAQTSPQRPDSFVTIHSYIYNKKGKATEMKTFEIVGFDTTKYTIKYEYDKADNLKTILTFNSESQLIEKRSYDFTPVSKKLLEFTTETKLPKEKFTKGWNYYNFDAQLSRTQYSNNTWLEFVYKDNGLLDQTLSYNMEGKLNSWKRYYYEFYEGNE